MANASGPQESKDEQIAVTLGELARGQGWLGQSREQFKIAEEQLTDDLKYINDMKIKLYQLGWKG